MQDINLYHLLRFYLKNWAWIVLLTIVGGLAGYVFSNYIQVPLYKSDATLLLVSTDAQKTTQDSKLINNYIELLKSRRVLEPVLNKRDYGIAYEDLVNSIEAANEKNTEVIKIAIDSKDPQISQELVDGVVASFREEVKELYAIENITIVDNASRPTEPYNIRTVIFTSLTTAAGFFLSVIILFFIYDLSSQKSKKLKTKVVIAKKTHPKKRTIVKDVANLLVGVETPATSTPKKPVKRAKAKTRKK